MPGRALIREFQHRLGRENVFTEPADLLEDEMDQLREAVLSAGLEVADERSFTHHCFPFIHNIVYGLGKTVLEAGLLPDDMAAAANRHNHLHIFLFGQCDTLPEMR